MSGTGPAFRTLELSDPAIDPRGLHFATVKSAALGQRAGSVGIHQHLAPE